MHKRKSDFSDSNLLSAKKNGQLKKKLKTHKWKAKVLIKKLTKETTITTWTWQL